jgi:hypothetical protein
MSKALIARVEDAVNRALVALEIDTTKWKASVYHDRERFGGVTVRLDKIETCCTGVSLPDAQAFDAAKLQRYFELQITAAMKETMAVDWLTACPGPDIVDVSRKMREFDEERVDRLVEKPA